MYDKPYFNYEDLFHRMSQKNIIVDKNPIFVLECLESISYYTLVNGYKDIYGTYFDSEDNIEKFSVKVNFDELYSLASIDASLNSVFFKYIIYVEKSLKTKLSHIVAREYGEGMNDYLDFKHYKNHSQLDRMTEVNNIKAQIIRSKNASLKHYRSYRNHIPPWIGVNGIYFGSAINWYKILQPVFKTEIVLAFFKHSRLDQIADKKELFISCLSLLQTYRNNIAHGNRTFQSTITKELPKKALLKAIPSTVLTSKEYDSGVGKKDLFAVIVSIVMLMNNRYLLQSLELDLRTVLQPYEDTLLSNEKYVMATLGLPNDVLKRIEILRIEKFQ